MAGAQAPITLKEQLLLPSLGINQQFITFNNVTMESEKFICVRETTGNNSVVIVDMATPMQPMRRPITADSALMNPVSKVIALKAQMQGTAQDYLQIFNIEMKSKMKSFQMPEQVVYWKWFSPSALGIVTNSAVYHWSMEGATEPVKMFDRSQQLANNQIISYKVDPSEKWMILIGIAPGAAERPNLVRGNMQLYSVEQQRSQNIEAHSASFAKFKDHLLITFASKTLKNGQLVAKLHIIELGAKPGQPGFAKKEADLFFAPDFADDFPVGLQISNKYGLIYVITKLGILFVYDLETAAPIFRNRISPDPVFLTAEAPTSGGFFAINRRGQVLMASVNESTIVPFISSQLNNVDLALALAKRANLTGAGDLIFKQFDQLFAQGRYKEAADLAAESPQGSLRTRETVQKFKNVPAPAGQPPPLLQYFGTLLTKGTLNAFESVELARLVLEQNKKQLLDNWLKENKLEASEELGDLLAAADPDAALKIYVKAKANSKVVLSLAQRKQFDKIIQYSQQVGFTPDYLQLLMQLMMNDPQGAVNFALNITQQEGGSPIDINTVTDLFLQRNMIREATSFLLDVLKPNRPEDANLQTKVLEINLITFPTVADAILNNAMFTHYDRARIAQLCERAGLYMRALQHYTDLPDIKRVIVNTHSIEPQALVEFFGTLSREWALDCIKELLQTNMKQNLQIIVQICKEYTEQLGAESIIELLEEYKTYEGLYLYLSSYVAFTEDPDIHYKYIEAAAKTGQIREVERITRESQSYNPEKTKQFLMEEKLPDARPLINVCDRFDFVHDLTVYLYNNNMLRYIEGYVQKVNPAKTPQVVGALLDVECQEDFVKNLIISVRALLPVEPLVAEVEKRNRLKILSNFLEHLEREGSQDVHVHNALGKIIVDANNNPEHFLTTNPYYDSLVVGTYCEKRDPYLACVAFKRGQCDMELVRVTNENSLFKLQARYIVERMDPDLWEKVLVDDNPHKRSLIDQVVSTALPESKNPEQVSVTVKAFMAADLPSELIELLEKIVLQSSAFSGNPNLQNLLILTAIKADKTRVMDYIHRLDKFDGPAVGEIAVGSELYEEAFEIFRKFKHNVQAISVLIDNIENLERANEYAQRVEDPEVWSTLAKAQIAAGMVPEAITSYLKAEDNSNYADVIKAAQDHGTYEDLIKYLLMARKKIKEKVVDSTLIYAYAKVNRLADLEEFLTVTNNADKAKVGDQCFDEELYEAARVLYSSLSNYGRLASTYVKLHQFQAAADSARKANSAKTWKEVCFACVDEEEFRLAQVCGLNIIVHADELDEICKYYQKRGKFEELINLMEAGLGLERAHMGIFTELGILYAKFKEEKLMEHLKLFINRVNIPKLIRICDEQQHWKELAYLYEHYDEYDNAAQTMMQHSSLAWEHVSFKDVLVKVSNVELYYRAVGFYLEMHPTQVCDLLTVLSPRIDHSRCVDLIRRQGHLPLVKSYLKAVQQSDLQSVNEAINDLCVEEEDYEGLRESIDTYHNFDHVALAISIEKHELMEFRRIASLIYKKNQRWRQSVDISKADKMFKDAMQTVAQSGDSDLAEELLTYFVNQKNKECFAACLFTCYDLIKPDLAMELAWMNDMTDFVMPYMIQCMKEFGSKVEKLLVERKEALDNAETAKKEAVAEEQKQNMYATLMPPALPAPNMPAGSYPPPGGAFPQPGAMPPGVGGPMPPYGMQSM